MGDKVYQAGSYIDEERLRLDFTYPKKLTDDDVLEVENQVNELIRKKQIISTEVMPIDKAKKLGAMALFTEKYGEVVRVVKIGKSIELCGGTHANNTKDIEKFAIFSYESKGSNTYRIEAVTGKKIENTLFNVIKPYNDEMIKLLMKARAILDEASKNGIVLDFDVHIDNSKPESYKDIIFNCNELGYIQGEVRDLEKKFQEQMKSVALKDLGKYREMLRKKDGLSYIVMPIDNADNYMLKVIADHLANELEPCVIFLANVKDDSSVNFICRSSASLHAGLLMKKVSTFCNGNGGGSNTFAQGGTKKVDDLEKLLKEIKQEIIHGK